MLVLVAREAARPFQVLTPVAQITVTGTAFEASAAADALEIAVFHGSVECRSAAGQARARRGMHLIGDPETVRNRILDLVAATGADEVMVTSSIHSHAERLRSYDLLAEAFAQ
jgi:ferric-dicitrate binding protein FerR (iron transport regulator)